MKTTYSKALLFSLLLPFAWNIGLGQTITGAWRGKISNAKIELKLVKTGDSLLGTAYYYTNASHFRRFSVRGYFNAETNDVIWWDDALLDETNAGNLYGMRADDALLSVADFNCPGADEMMLDGSSNLKTDRDSKKRSLHLEKITDPVFADEWDYVLENYFVGANDPRIIDSIARLGQAAPLYQDEELIASQPRQVMPGSSAEASPEIRVAAPPAAKVDIAEPLNGLNVNEKKFNSRKKVLQTVIPVTAKTIELRFYDNAQIDGDSIALFLNNRLIFEHIFLTDKPYVVKLNADDLAEDNELVMVAENLGSIPPNTSFMVAIVGDKRYEARLFANEHSSALIRFVKTASEAP